MPPVLDISVSLCLSLSQMITFQSYGIILPPSSAPSPPFHYPPQSHVNGKLSQTRTIILQGGLSIKRSIARKICALLLSLLSHVFPKQCQSARFFPLYQSVCCMPILAGFVRVFLSISLSVVCLFLQGLCGYSSLSVCLLSAYSCRFCAGIPLYQSVCCLPILAGFERVFLSISLSVVCLFL